jgi:hypothetical protein
MKTGERGAPDGGWWQTLQAVLLMKLMWPCMRVVPQLVPSDRETYGVALSKSPWQSAQNPVRGIVAESEYVGQAPAGEAQIATVTTARMNAPTKYLIADPPTCYWSRVPDSISPNKKSHSLGANYLVPSSGPPNLATYFEARIRPRATLSLARLSSTCKALIFIPPNPTRSSGQSRRQGSRTGSLVGRARRAGGSSQAHPRARDRTGGAAASDVAGQRGHRPRAPRLSCTGGVGSRALGDRAPAAGRPKLRHRSDVELPQEFTAMLPS